MCLAAWLQVFVSMTESACYLSGMVNYMAQQFEVCVKVWVCVRACGCIFAGKVITKQAWGIAGLLGCCTGCCCTSTALASGSCVPPGVLAAH